MHVAVARLTLRLPENHSLKEKRHVIHSLSSRLRNRFNVAVAEVDGHDLWQLAILGITSVSSDASQAQEILASVARYVDGGLQGDAEVVEWNTEVLPGP
ncbi:MAG: DUF503 domain-containing protein [Chloroflexi bacterium]|nr:DUF503 domain-containing protein [Chloroflexota bacterium]